MTNMQILKYLKSHVKSHKLDSGNSNNKVASTFLYSQQMYMSEMPNVCICIITSVSYVQLAVMIN